MFDLLPLAKTSWSSVFSELEMNAITLNEMNAFGINEMNATGRNRYTAHRQT